MRLPSPSSPVRASALFLILASLGGPAAAQGAFDPQTSALLLADANGDGDVAADEWAALLSELDPDGDGELVASADAEFNLGLTIDVSDPNSPQFFVKDTTGITASANISAARRDMRQPDKTWPAWPGTAMPPNVLHAKPITTTTTEIHCFCFPGGGRRGGEGLPLLAQKHQGCRPAVRGGQAARTTVKVLPRRTVENRSTSLSMAEQDLRH